MLDSIVETILKHKKEVIFFSLATILDGVTTYYTARKYGINKEISLPLRMLMTNFGVVSGVVLGKIYSYTTIILSSNLEKNYSKEILYGMGSLTMIAGLWNLYFTIL